MENYTIIGLTLLFAGWLLFNWEDFFTSKSASKLENNIREYEKRERRKLRGLQEKKKGRKSETKVKD